MTSKFEIAKRNLLDVLRLAAFEAGTHSTRYYGLRSAIQATEVGELADTRRHLLDAFDFDLSDLRAKHLINLLLTAAPGMSAGMEACA
jgi:hypothetical protein